MGPQPVDAAGPLQPFIGFGFALEALDGANLDARVVRLYLPVVRRDALVFEGDAGLGASLGHARTMPNIGSGRQSGSRRAVQADRVADWPGRIAGTDRQHLRWG